MTTPLESVHTATAGVTSYIQHCSDWTVHELHIETVASLNDDTPCLLDLISTFGAGSYTTQKMKNLGLDRYWLPKKFNRNDEVFRSKELCQHFSVPALHAGFALRIRGWKADRNHLQFKCVRGTYYAPSRPKKKEVPVEPVNIVKVNSKLKNIFPHTPKRTIKNMAVTGRYSHIFPMKVL